ncbi:hypothetical protein U14_04684 [Candidatus Moduliflexus flocculans]|uniref:Uncharacterized protein n=1 Tax=Candidatus Moduliflexus flocculans TaxID=1499966 RepID=A0A0S6W4K2_9BACT|nr:hypothetical protein U14_04684 [Candidatus Moduliflexus flocculans]
MIRCEMRMMIIMVSAILMLGVLRGGMAVEVDLEQVFPQPCVIEFHGVINVKSDIRMTLSRNEQRLEGTYFYPRYQEEIVVKGTISHEGQMLLSEYGDRRSPDQATAMFEGHFVSANRIEGEWRAVSHTRSDPFVLERAPTVLLSGTFNEMIPFRVLANPVLDMSSWAEDEVMLSLDGFEKIPLTRQQGVLTCGQEGAIDPKSFDLRMLPGSPALMQITWSHTHYAQTLGTDCLLIVRYEHTAVPLFDTCVASYRETFSTSHVEKFSAVTYAQNRLSVTISRSEEPEGSTYEEEIRCSYEVNKEGLIFLDAQAEFRTVQQVPANSEDEQHPMTSWQALQTFRQEDCMHGVVSSLEGRR